MEDMVKKTDSFSGIYKDRKVLVTGHTGFKGSWLCLWLRELGAKVAGLSLYLPSQPCNFEALDLARQIDHVEGDIRKEEDVRAVFEKYEPEVVFHLAAQPIVRRSYDQAKLTFETNLLGTVNVLDAIRTAPSVKAGVIITSDKCYENLSWDWGYRETDRLGGADPYSASKACAEIACSSYIRSFFSSPDSACLATTRAGNVIGPGDWAEDRIVPDCIRAWSKKDPVVIRSPEATRPWQFVLEPLSGYLWLAALLFSRRQGVCGEAFNFGPNSEVVKSVGELAEKLASYWGRASLKQEPSRDRKTEATLLKLNCDKALNRLGWEPVLGFDDTARMTALGYKSFYENDDYPGCCRSVIKEYVCRAKKKSLVWTKGEK